MYPKISVIIPAYNEEKYIAECLSHIKNQDYPGEVEIIVVNNNSTDDTERVIINCGVTPLFEAESGVVKSLLRGVKQASGDFFAFTDADTHVPKNWLSRAYQIFEGNDDIVAVGGPYYFFDAVPGANKIFGVLNLITKIFFPVWPGLAGCNMIVRRTAYEKIGGFNPDLKRSQDSDLSRRLSRAGKVLYLLDFYVLTSFRRYRGNETKTLKIFLRMLNQGLDNAGKFILRQFFRVPKPPRKVVR